MVALVTTIILHDYLSLQSAITFNNLKAMKKEATKRVQYYPMQITYFDFFASIV